MFRYRIRKGTSHRRIGHLKGLKRVIFNKFDSILKLTHCFHIIFCMCCFRIVEFTCLHCGILGCLI